MPLLSDATRFRSFYRFFFSLSFRTHLILIVLLLSLPAAALVYYSGWQQRRDALNAGTTEAKMLVHTVLTEQYNTTGDAEQLVMTLAQVSDVKEHRVAAAEAILSAILKLNRQYTNIVICDRAGEIWASALPHVSRFSVREARAYRDALATRRFSAGEYGVGRISGRPNLSFGYPVLNGAGAVDAVILVSVDFNYLNDLLVETGLPKGSSFTMADHRGVVVYRNLRPEEAIGGRLPESELRQMRQGGSEVKFLKEAAGSDSISAFGTLRLRGDNAPYLYVKAGIPLRQTLVKANRAQLLNLAVLSPVVLAAVLAASLLAKLCFVNRIQRLQEAAQRLAQGEHGFKVAELVGGGELGALGRSFDDMAGQLAARERALNDLNQSLALRVELETGKRLEQERILARHTRLAAIGEMIGAIAHQWRQPLATLGATVQSLRMAWERRMLDGAFLARAEADAQKQLYYMSDTIEDFRNFFSPDKVMETFDVKARLKEVSLLVSAQFAHSGVRLSLLDPAPESELQIRGYQNEFKQSVLNLVSNAFDAVAANRGLAPGSGRVLISVVAASGRVVIEVADNGCGIQPEIAEKVYEPYFTSKPAGKGTGIGLYMSKLIIEESMGGRLSFKSRPDGTVFSIVLPIGGAVGEEQNDG